MYKRSDKAAEVILLNEESTTGTPSLVVGHNKATGSPSDNYETVIQFEGQTSTTPNVFVAAIKAIRRVIAHATRRSAVAIYGDFEGDPVQLANFESPDYESSVPDPRGEGSVDLQSGRFSSSSVASGYASALLGGEDNQVSDFYGVNCGGSTNVVSGDTAFNGGGEENLVSNETAVNVGGIANEVAGEAGTNVGGDTNTVTGARASNVGGLGNEVTGPFASNGGGIDNEVNGYAAATPGGGGNILDGDYSSAVGGANGRAPLMGQHIHSVGFFAVQGDAQVSELVFRIETADNTPAILLLDEQDRLVLRDNEVWSYEGRIVARKTAGGIQHAEYKIEGLIHRNAGVGTTAMDRQVVTTLYEDNAAWAVALTADAVNGALQIQVTGAAGVVIQWVGFVKIVSTLL